ncbi:MAG TPA: type I secretion system permease/ATPase [Hyphomicrobium sp.]|nr:type I secretion system permease/ATPase [Hyphomicrobium sp.]
MRDSPYRRDRHARARIVAQDRASGNGSFVKRIKDKKQAERERMTNAMRRLEQLLQDPGPGITVTPAGERDFGRSLHMGAPMPGAQSSPAPGTASRAPQDVNTAAATETAAAQIAAASSPDEPKMALAGDEAASTRPEWVEALTNGPKTPPARVKPGEAESSTPKGGLAANMRGFAPERSNAGLFGLCLRWFFGPRDSEIKNALRASRRALNATFLFSAVINILMLAGPIFMLQVYDRVLGSGSFPTLITLFAITAALYAIIGMLELARSRIISRVGAEIDQRLSDRIFEASLRKSLATQGAAAPALRELDSFRQFISGPAPITFFDAPWTPVYLGFITMTHWTLGAAALIGTLILLVLAWASEQSGRAPLMQASQAVTKSLEMAETGQRNAEAITAMGMLSSYRKRWQTLNGEGLGWQLLASDRLGGLSAITKTTRLLLQSMMLAIAAALAVGGEITSGAIIAATIIFGRALAPVEQAVGHWRAFIKARESYRKLDDVLSYAPPDRERTRLPRPKGVLDVHDIRVAAPETRNVILSGITFRASPGQMLAIIGPSASGKSTLVRAIVGLWPTFSGGVLIDGARLDQWHPEDLGRYIGYLPQTVELFAGTVRQNIARFREDASDEEVIEAAKQAHAHDLILGLPRGYETELGTFGSYLSGGQRQRIALARALFGNPPLVVLDEPNSNLDRPGDEALSAAIDGMRKRGQTVILVSHRVQAIGKADLLLLIERGQQRAYGPRGEVMKLFQGPRGAGPSAQAAASPDDRRTQQKPDASAFAAPAEAPDHVQGAA